MFMWTLGTWRSLCELQVWKFPKGFNVRDLKAHVEAKPEPLLPVGLPGEVTPSETGHKTRVSERSDASTDSFSSAASRGNTSGRRASLLLPGKEDPKWLSLQQVMHHCFFTLHITFLLWLNCLAASKERRAAKADSLFVRQLQCTATPLLVSGSA